MADHPDRQPLTEREARSAVRRAVRKEEEARKAKLEAVYAARYLASPQVPWSELEVDTGVQASTMRGWIYEAHPELRPVSVAAAFEEREERAGKPRPRRDPLPGVSVPAYARATGLAPNTVYARIDAGAHGEVADGSTGEVPEGAFAVAFPRQSDPSKTTLRIVDPEAVALVEEHERSDG